MARKLAPKGIHTPRFFQLMRLSALVAAEEDPNNILRGPTANERRFRRLADAVFNDPAKGLAGLCEIAVIGRHWAERGPNGELLGRRGEQPIGARSLIELLNATLELAAAE